jgi:hypothetical protein
MAPQARNIVTLHITALHCLALLVLQRSSPRGEFCLWHDNADGDKPWVTGWHKYLHRPYGLKK